MKSVKKFLSTQ